MSSWQKLIDVYYSTRTMGNVMSFSCFHLRHELCLLGKEIPSHLVSCCIERIRNALADTCIHHIHWGILILKNIILVSCFHSFHGSILWNRLNLWISELKVGGSWILSFLCMCIRPSLISNEQFIITKPLLLVDSFINTRCLQKLSFSNIMFCDGFNGAVISLSNARVLMQVKMVILEYFLSWLLTWIQMFRQWTLTYCTLGQILSESFKFMHIINWMISSIIGGKEWILLLLSLLGLNALGSLLWLWQCTLCICIIVTWFIWPWLWCDAVLTILLLVEGAHTPRLRMA